MAIVLAKILARLETLEKQFIPPPTRCLKVRNKLAQRPVLPQRDTRAFEHPGEPASTLQKVVEVKEDFIPVSRNGRGRKGKGKVAQQQKDSVPTFYISSAVAAANTKQLAPLPPTV